MRLNAKYVHTVNCLNSEGESVQFKPERKLLYNFCRESCLLHGALENVWGRVENPCQTTKYPSVFTAPRKKEPSDKFDISR